MCFFSSSSSSLLDQNIRPLLRCRWANRPLQMVAQIIYVLLFSSSKFLHHVSMTRLWRQLANGGHDVSLGLRPSYKPLIYKSRSDVILLLLSSSKVATPRSCLGFFLRHSKGATSRRALNLAKGKWIDRLCVSSSLLFITMPKDPFHDSLVYSK
jgi:hypothetical protein